MAAIRRQGEGGGEECADNRMDVVPSLVVVWWPPPFIYWRCVERLLGRRKMGGKGASLFLERGALCKQLAI